MHRVGRGVLRGVRGQAPGDVDVLLVQVRGEIMLRVYLVRLAATGAVVGTVEALSLVEALGRACVLAVRSGHRPQRLDVRAAAVGRA